MLFWKYFLLPTCQLILWGQGCVSHYQQTRPHGNFSSGKVFEANFSSPSTTSRVFLAKTLSLHWILLASVPVTGSFSVSLLSFRCLYLVILLIGDSNVCVVLGICI